MIRVRLLELMSFQSAFSLVAGYHPEDITYVVCTHGHADHCGNLNLFTNKTRRMVSLLNDQDRAEDDLLRSSPRPSKIKRHIVGNGVYTDDEYWFDLKNEDRVFQINPLIAVRETPGHTLSCVSVLVENVANLGRVAVTGDLFEREEDLNDENIWIDAGSESVDEQRENRQFVLDNFDWIVPGHGPMFKVRK